MMNTITLELDEAAIRSLQSAFPANQQNTNVAYTRFQIKTEGCTITVYTSNKVVFSGKRAAALAAPYQPKRTSVQLPMGGSDEVGTGDYFGPVVVCACIVNDEDMPVLTPLNIMDSKQLTDDTMRAQAPLLMERLSYSLLILDNVRYNKVHATQNLNTIKAKLHNKAYVNLSHKTRLPDFSVVDQFMEKSKYYTAIQQEPEIIRNLHFETKAENKYIAVACASIIARYGFLKTMDQMGETYSTVFPKGAGAHVDSFGREFVQRYGEEALQKVAKVHFINSTRILDK